MMVTYPDCTERGQWIFMFQNLLDIDLYISPLTDSNLYFFCDNNTIIISKKKKSMLSEVEIPELL